MIGDAANAETIREAVAVLARGGLVAFPTETVYGLGADASNETAVRRIFSVKGRPADHPLIVHLARVEQLADWAQRVPEAAWRLAEAFWPGPLTLVLPRAPRVLDVVTGGQESVGIRVPSHPVAQALLQAFGGGIAGPSANRFGRVSPTTAEHVRAELGSEVDLVLEGGQSEVGIESTIVDLSSDRPALLRPGIIGAERIAAVLGNALHAPDRTSPRASGMLASHYAPRTPSGNWPPQRPPAPGCWRGVDRRRTAEISYGSRVRMTWRPMRMTCTPICELSMAPAVTGSSWRRSPMIPPGTRSATDWRGQPCRCRSDAMASPAANGEPVSPR